MSTELVEKEIARFLASPDAEVLCLRGKWGVGKTYSWNEFLKQAQRQKRVALKSYSYVALFGLESLDQLKYAIFENSVGTDSVGVEPSLDTLRTNTASVASRLGRKSWSVLQHLPKVKDFAAAVQSLSFLSVRNTIICIDDLERKGGHLPTKDVLGLISQLKDQRKCKVALILNADELEERGRWDGLLGALQAKPV
jgi:Cdc6-like AAA superfamily ATPase